jgi:hypothetical protein
MVAAKEVHPPEHAWSPECAENARFKRWTDDERCRPVNHQKRRLSGCGRAAGTVAALKLHDIFDGALETEAVLSVVDGPVNMVVELVHQDGSIAHPPMSRSALRRSDDEIALAAFQDLTGHLWVNDRG